MEQGMEGQQAQGPEAQLQALAQQYAETGDPQIAVQIADMLVEAMGLGGGAAQGGGGGDPAAQGAPPAGGGQQFRTGGNLKPRTAMAKYLADRKK